MLQCPKYFVPGLDTKPFFSMLEAGVNISASEMVTLRSEALALLSTRRTRLDCESPELATTGQWYSVEILRRGNKRLDVSAEAPTIHGRCVHAAQRLGYGSVFISVLDPGTRIAPHYGLSNAKLRCQIQLAGGPAVLTVGKEAKTLTQGQLVIFDDSIIHWVQYPDSDGTQRICLVWDVSHPAASSDMVEYVRTKAMAATDAQQLKS